MITILKKRFSADSALMLIILVINGLIIVGLWVMGAKAESFVASLIGLSFWAIKISVSKHFKEIDRKADQQNKIILQGIQTGYEFKQTVMQNMYEITNELWNHAIWIAMNWNRLWPGQDSDIELRNIFNAKFDKYLEFMNSNSINIPLGIYTAANKLVEGIDTYKKGRMFKGDESLDTETRREGHKSMSEGTRLIRSSTRDLFHVIREEFGLDQLPGEVLNIPTPEEHRSKNKEAE